jgi:membrane carboxypeptidase/penicillin-binding protein PbpC
MTTPEWVIAEAPTMPLRAVSTWGEEDFRGPERVEPGVSRYEVAGPRRQRSRWIKRFTGTVLALAAVCAIAFTGLMLALPGVGDAPGLAQALDRAHHAAYLAAALPPRVAAALVATEDQWFYSEPGIDLAAGAQMMIGRLGDGPDQGASTLYQQLATILYVPDRSGPLAGAEQVLLGIKLDLNFSKAQILQMYGDVAYFGHGYYGLAAASCGYFAERPAALSWGQAAMLAGQVHAPSSDDPFSHYANARAREARVLIRLIDTGKLTQQQASQAYRAPLHLARGKTGGCAPVSEAR